MSSNETISTVIGPGTRISGEMTFDSSARVLGTFEGKINAAGDLHIGEDAVCRAEINAATLLVDGTIEGNITSTQRLQLNASARVEGDLVARTLIVDEGACFTGHCRVGDDVRPDRSGERGSSINEVKARTTEVVGSELRLDKEQTARAAG